MTGYVPNPSEEDNVPHIRWRDAWNLEELV